MTAYYNEIDKFAAGWLRELIKAGLIAEGKVDERSIEDVTPKDLIGFTQCHFFAGIGGWSLALRQAGWSDERPIWTGSCPCQPFSSAGKGKGTADERHLWPQFHRLISECRPEYVIGEQVANKAGESWFDIVRASLESENYAAGLSVFPACGVGAPHMRKRLYWGAHKLANPTGNGRAGEGQGAASEERLQPRPKQDGQLPDGLEGRSATCSVANTASKQKHTELQTDNPYETERITDMPCGCCTTGKLANASKPGLEGHTGNGNGSDEPGREQKNTPGPVAESSRTVNPGPVNGEWRDADWLYCRDGKWRPVEPGLEPLANGITNRVGLLRGYGNAIVIPQARAFIEAFMECIQ